MPNKPTRKKTTQRPIARRSSPPKMAVRMHSTLRPTCCITAWGQRQTKHTPLCSLKKQRKPVKKAPSEHCTCCSIKATIRSTARNHTGNLCGPTFLALLSRDLIGIVKKRSKSLECIQQTAIFAENCCAYTKTSA